MTVSWLRPQENIDEQETRTGLNMLLVDGVCSQIMGVLTGGAFLVAFALQIGASNVVIGLLAAVGPFAQMLQIPAIFLIERTAQRKAAVVISSFGSRLFWILAALVPWLLPKPLQVPVLMGSILLYFGLGAISGLAFNSWMRDFIPESIRGSYSGKRMALSTAIGAGLSLLAGICVDLLKPRVPEIGIYSTFFLIGAAAGLFGVYFLTRIPEPRMTTASRGMLAVLIEPFRDANFRQLLIFLGSWNFVSNLAAPFFTVYMLQRIGLSMTLVLVLSVVSQVVNAVFFQLWGRLADRFSNKTVLGEAGPLFLLSIVLFPFTTRPETYSLTIPLLILIHILAGMSSAGVLLCSGNIAIKLAPQGKATPYLATNALVSGMTATIAPILGGLAADWFARRELSLTVKWMSDATQQSLELSAIHLRGLDFLFLIAFFLGLYALHRLVLVKELGEIEEDILIPELQGLVRKVMKNVTNVAGLRQFFFFPYGRLMEMIISPEPSADDGDLPDADEEND